MSPASTIHHAVHAPVGGPRAGDDFPGLLVDARLLLHGRELALARLYLEAPVLDLLRGKRADPAYLIRTERNIVPSWARALKRLADRGCCHLQNPPGRRLLAERAPLKPP